MAEKGQIYVLTLNNDNGDPETVIVYNKIIKTKRHEQEELMWKVFNLTGNKIKVCVTDFQLDSKPNNPFEKPPDEPYCVIDVGPNGGTKVLKSPKVRLDADKGTYNYTIVLPDFLIKNIAYKKLPFTTGAGKTSLKVDPELEMDL
jgi:hypothetical protein